MNRQNDLFLFVRPPRPLWPFNGPGSAFWPPLAFASLAARLRQGLPDLRVQILDAPALEMGWRSLESELRSRRPRFIGIGEEAVSCVEGLRLARLAKNLGARVVAGGCFFGHVAAEVLRTDLVDFVVHGEGEETLLELIATLRDGSPDVLDWVKGISFRRENEIVTTQPRPLIKDLDSLPLPAYDLLPVERYGARSLNHQQLAAIELGRGCSGSCDFCVLWRQMGRPFGHSIKPLLRVKSAERLLEEIRILVQRYDRRYLGWVDPCFNAHPQVPAQLAELLLRDNLRIGQSAWLRTDALVRDADSGALASCVRSGLNEVFLGIERADAAGLAGLHKTSTTEHARQALTFLRQRFPQVVVVGSFIYGLPGDTPATVRAIHSLAFELDLDEFFFIPLTPLPGTSGWRSEMWDPSGKRFRKFSFLPANNRHSHYAILERALLVSLLLNWPLARLRSWFHQIWCRDLRRRRVQWRLHFRAIRFYLSRLRAAFLRQGDFTGLIFPNWYEK